MAVLTEDMKRVILEQHLGYVATVCPDGTPNLSPKGTTAVWDDEHIVFADIHSPGTTANLKHNPTIEINVVDWFVRKGYRFKGSATVLESGTLFDTLLAFYQQRGTPDAVRRIRAIVMVKVERALPLISPVYDGHVSEEQVRARWEEHYQQIRPQK